VADHALHVLDCGTLTFPRYGIYFNGGDEIIVVPIPAHVITHPEGNVLYDTGFPLEAFSDPGYFGEGLAGYKQGDSRENHVVEQVKAAGFEPDSIRYVVQTHLHFDHVGAIGHFPDAEFLVHRDDWNYAHNADWFIEFAYPLQDIDRPGVRWKFLDELNAENEYDLYGDGRIRLIQSPGHSPGVLSLIGKLDNSSVILTGDAVVTIDHWRNEALPFFLDAPAVARSTERLRQIEKRENIDLVIFGHDAEQFAGLKKHTDAYT
jgi:glyoxylase-like metal-dependent hydrolase (beta-lactamase superfamily II)